MPQATAEGADGNPGDVEGPTLDGRRLRSERSRASIVAALLALIREGEVRPSAAAVAARAGVNVRTIFNHFGDMESLMAIASATQFERVMGLLPVFDPEVHGTHTLEDRLASLCGQLSLLLEDTMHVRWTAVTFVPMVTSDARARHAIDETRALLRSRVAAFIEPELSSIGLAAREALLDALDTVHDPIVWRLRRFQQDLSFESASTVMGTTVVALVRHALTTGSEGSPTT